VKLDRVSPFRKVAIGTWQTTYEDAGTYEPAFVARDGKGGIDIEIVRIEVLNRNRQPVITGRIPVGDGHPSYVPDVLVTFIDFDVWPQTERTVLYEIKHREELRDNWHRWKPRFKAARRFAKERGWSFRVITDREIRAGGLLWNAKFLLPYTHDEVTDGVHTLLIKTLRHLGPTTPEKLVSHLAKDPWERATLLASVWTMVASRTFLCDLSCPISMHTELSAYD